MGRKIQISRGPEANLPILDIGEPAITTDSIKPFIGSAIGNVQLAKESDRLSDKAESATKVEVALKRDKVVKLNATTDFDTETLAQMTGVTPITYSPIPANNTLVGQQIKGFTVGKNKFNQNAITVGKYQNPLTGGSNTQAGKNLSEYMPMTSVSNYAQLGITNISFWDASKVYISGISAMTTTFVTPANTAYGVIQVDDVNLAIVQLETGTVKTVYEAYKIILTTPNTGIEFIPPVMKVEDLPLAITKEFYSQQKFGFNPTFETLINWYGTVTGTSTKTWKANAGLFKEGNNYLEIVRGDTNIGGIMLDEILPTLYQKDVTRKMRIVVTYASNIDTTLLVYQRATPTTWCNPNTSVSTTLLNTLGIEKTIEIIIPVLWDSTGATLYSTFAVAGTLNIGSVHCFVLGNEKTSASAIATKYTVASTGGDYTTIAGAIAACVSPSINNQFNIFIKNGTYNEINLLMRDYVHLEGESRDGVIIRGDGTLTPPTDVPAWTSKSGIFLTVNCNVKNLTIHTNDAKYCIHADNVGIYTANFTNLRLIHHDGCFLGTGLRANQNINFEDIICEYVGTTGYRFDSATEKIHGVLYHNIQNQTAPHKLSIKRMQCINCHILDVQDLGSSQIDTVELIDCKTNLLDGQLKIRSTAGYYIPPGDSVAVSDPLLVPYNVDLHIASDIPYFWVDDTRLAGNYHATGWYDSKVYNSTGVTLLRGQAVVLDYFNSSIKQVAVKIPTSNKLNGIILQDIIAGQFGWMAIKGKTVKVLFGLSAVTKGDYLQFNFTTGLFEASTETNGTAVCSETTASSGGNKLIKALLL